MRLAGVSAILSFSERMNGSRGDSLCYSSEEFFCSLILSLRRRRESRCEPRDKASPQGLRNAGESPGFERALKCGSQRFFDERKISLAEVAQKRAEQLPVFSFEKMLGQLRACGRRDRLAHRHAL